MQRINLCSARSASRDITLPDTASVPPVSIKTSEVNVPATSQAGVETVSRDQLSVAIEKQVHWLKHCEQHLNEELTKGIHLSWAAYHASVTELPNPLPYLGSLLPLFYEKAATVAMMKHGMSVIKKATEFLNPGRIPVTVCDQPLFAIAKVVQWNWPAIHRENVDVVMLGGLHIEMVLLTMCGDLLALSGWTTALTEEGIVSSGTSESFLNPFTPRDSPLTCLAGFGRFGRQRVKVAHLTKTRCAHQVIAAALYKLQHVAFQELNAQQDEEEFQKHEAR